MTGSPRADTFDPAAISRPAPQLLKYYVTVSALASIVFPPIFPLIFIPLLLRYRTLRYRFDDDGIAMSWGFLFRREINLTYRRIQDIHVTRGLVQRWLGLASISVQTASGTAGAEMVIDGVLEVDALRDHLYRKMRGARETRVPGGAPGDEAGDGNEVHPVGAALPAGDAAEILQVLCDIRDALRDAVERDGATPPAGNRG